MIIGKERLEKELKQEKEKNKELKEELQKYISGQYFTEKQVKHLEMTRKMFWINKDKIRELKDFYVQEHKYKNIDLIPIKNIIDNLKILEEG